MTETVRKDADALRESCLRVLALLRHPVHHAVLAGIIRANTTLDPGRGQVLAALRGLRTEGLVERTRPGVYRATPPTLSKL